jgi:tetratricopeptide (TPR) repeat protein
MKKSAIVLFFAAFMSIGALAQNVQEGVNNLYAERYGSAKSVFDKLLAANPNNIEATYWLGQTYIAMKNVAAARSLYDKALTANGNAPLILAGMGHVNLLEGKAAEARQRFESAITASRGKKGPDPVVLSAIGRANTDAYSVSTRSGGDIDYAISKLNEAAAAAPTNAEVFLNLGNAYKKKGDGGGAVQAYRKAVQINPSLAVASYRTAMLFKTQTSYRQEQGWDVVMENLNTAIAADPKFAPAYEELYYYNLLKKQDFATAESFANKYISSSDPSVENDFLKMQTQYVQNKFTEAIATGKNIIAQTNNSAKPRVYRTMAYSYLGSRDTTAACDYVNQLFAKGTDEDIIGKDYLLHAYSCGRNNPDVIRIDVMKAVQVDSVLSRQLAILNEAIDDAKKGQQKVLEGELRLAHYQLRQQKGAATSPTELISYMSVPFYLGGAYVKADSVAKVYATLLPDSIYGHYWSALALSRIDSTMQQGLAVPAFERSLQIAETDKVRYQSQGVQSASTLAIYYNNIKTDRTKALNYVQKGLEFDPTNANLLSFQKALSVPVRQNAPTQKTSTGTNQAKETKTKVKKG